MAAPVDYRKVAAQDAAKYGLGQWFVRQIGQESGFNPNARSGAGAQGIAQFIPSTAHAYGLTNPYDPIASLDAAARYDRDLLKRYGNPQRALSAYNSGRPDAYLDPNFAGGQTYRYVRSILADAAGGAPGAQPGAAPAPHSLVAAAGAPPPQPKPLPDFRTQLLSALTQSRQQGDDLTGFYGELGQAIQKRNAVAQQNAHLATAAAGPQPGPPGQPQPPGAPHGLAIPVHGQIGREDPHFLAELTAAARARGAVAIVATSGERTPQHNAAIGGASHSNHLPDAHGYGHALDGYAVLPDGRRVPLGTFLQPNAGRFGLRSGATFQWGGRPDVVHVDDNRNHGH